MTLQDLKDAFSNPGGAYRGKPFWSWNGALDRDELLRQIHVLKDMGMGGYFCHSRTGLITEYLGTEWFELVNACADEGAACGMETWLYDEDRWPSGTAGGTVTEDPAYRMRFLRLNILPAGEYRPEEWRRAPDIFEADLEGVSFTGKRRLTGEAFPQRSHVLAFSIEELESSSFYNGFTYVDTMNPEATADFIRRTHERYAACCGERLGREITGIFTDEPHRGAVMCGFSVPNADPGFLAPYTPLLFNAFQERFGYDLRDHLPELFLLAEGKPLSPVKWAYMELLQSLFIDNFLKPLQAWCREHGMKLTGHLLHEDSLTAQAAMNGSLLRCYEYMDVPGIDILNEDGDLAVVPKQVASAARQNGQSTILSELYGATGWQMSFQNHKEVGDWQALFGINLRCHHLSWYSMQGEAKRDYPASIFFQSAWYKQYKYIEDYYARIHLLMQQGEPVCGLLVINPVESLWASVYTGWADGLQAADPEICRMENTYLRVFHALCDGHVDFDYADEDVLARKSVVEFDAGGRPYLMVGRASYRTVLVAGMRTIRSSTVSLLEQFAAGGGRIVFAGERPAYVDAEASGRVTRVSGEEVAVDGLEALLAPYAAIRIHDGTGRPLSGLYSQMRRFEGGYIVMLLNRERSGIKTGTVTFRVPGRVQRWNVRDGTVAGLSPEWERHPCIPLNLHPAEEVIYIVTEESCKAASRPEWRSIAVREFEGPFPFRLDEPNVCVLDMASYHLDGGEWQPAQEILKVDRAVRRAYGLPLRGGEMVQPWYAGYGEQPVKGKLELAFSFTVREKPGDIELAMETPERFEVFINDNKLDTASNGWWVDPCFRRRTIPGAWLDRGANTVRLSCDFTEDINLEAVYLLGSFGVELDGLERTLIPLPRTLMPGDVVAQGLPFYGAGIVYDLGIIPAAGEGQRLKLCTEGMDAACMEVRNGGTSRIIAFAPYEADVTDMAGDRAELAYILTRRNTFGPLHAYPERQNYYSPEVFVSEGKSCLPDRYGLLPQGMTKFVNIVWEEVQ